MKKSKVYATFEVLVKHDEGVDPTQVALHCSYSLDASLGRGDSGTILEAEIHSARTTPPQLHFSLRELLTLHAALSHLTRTHQRTPEGIIKFGQDDDMRQFIHPQDVTRLANRIGVQYALDASK